MALRVFLVARADGSYSVMPGGLARVSPDADGKFISMQHGGSSKDTWIISDGPVEETTLLHRAGVNFELRRTGNNLPSRLADNFFWLGRYSERADATARLLRSALRRFNPERTGGALPALAPLLQTLEMQGQLPGASWRTRSCAKIRRLLKPNCLRRYLTRRARAVCMALLAICSGWRRRFAIGLPAIYGA